MGPGHMDPTRAAQAAALLGAAVAIPIHWGTYYPIHLGMQGPPAFLEDAARAVRAGDLRSTRRRPTVRVLAPGEQTDDLT